MSRFIPKLAVAAAFVVLTAACGGGGNSASKAPTSPTPKPSRTVAVVMRDIAFDPTAVTVKRGEVVRFSFQNEGAGPHDAFIGDAKAQAKHESTMRSGDASGGSMKGMNGSSGGNSEGAITVQPGKTDELVVAFDKVGTMLIGCHQPGHFAAGMKIEVTVTE